MLFDAVCRFVALSGQVGVKGSDPSVRELMAVLRRGGFSSPQISELSGGKWSDTLVRQYTVDWGGVDDSMAVQRQSLMVVLRELVSSGRSVGDVEFALRVDRSVRAKGSSLKEVAELNSNLGALDMRRGEVGRLVTLSRELMEQGLTPGMVRAWMMIDQGLVEAGFNKNARWLMHEACEKYGGVNKTLESFNEYTSLRQIQLTRRSIEEEVEQLEEKKDKLSTDIEELEMVIAQSREMIDAANNAILAGFDAISLSMISISANKLGGPLKVVNAIRKYSSLEEMDGELVGKRAEREKLKIEISQDTMYLTALKNTLEEAKNEYDRNSDVMLLVELLVNPRGIKMERSDVLRLLTRVLESGILRIEESPSIVPLPSPALDAALEDIKALVKRLRLIIDA